MNRARGLVAAVGLALLPAAAVAQPTVEIPWRPGNAEHFRTGRWQDHERWAILADDHRERSA